MQTTETVTSGSEDGLSVGAILHLLDSGDVVIVVYGGYDHVGAVSLAIPRPSLEDPEKNSATSSVLTVLGHKEDILVKEIGEQVAAATGRNLVVVGGVHYDGLEAEQLEILKRLWRKLSESIILKLGRLG
ncbi:MAG: hypothetical protein GXO34_01320 [Deltaproteobacteria bacterium]|nr:hypothetical protein [Deltaproteobacteria bacterium]